MTTTYELLDNDVLQSKYAQKMGKMFPWRELKW